jgi:hypothetical protein
MIVADNVCNVQLFLPVVIAACTDCNNFKVVRVWAN